MSKMDIVGGVVIDYTEDGWDEYVKWLDGTKAALRYVYEQQEKSYYIVAIDEMVYRVFNVNIADASEFEADWKDDADPYGLVLEGALRPVTPMNGPYDAMNYSQSWPMDVPADSIGILDVWVGDYLVGPEGICWFEGGEYAFYTDMEKGSSVHFSVVDRDGVVIHPEYGVPVFELLGLDRTKLDSLTSISGTLEEGQVVWGATSGAHAYVLEVVDSDTVEITYHDGPFEDGEALSFKDPDTGTEEATATLGEWVEGDVYTIKTSMRDEWVRGYAAATRKPGGAAKLMHGLYLRAKVFNASTSDAAELIIRFFVLTK